MKSSKIIIIIVIAAAIIGGVAVSTPLIMQNIPAGPGPSHISALPGTPVLNQPSPLSTTGKITLTWNGVNQAMNFRIYRAQNQITGTVSELVITTLGNVTTFTDSVSNNGMYYYAIVATNTLGESPLSNCVSITVQIPPVNGGGITIEKPLAPVLSKDASSSGNHVVLTWTSISSAINYRMYRETSYISTIAGISPIATITASSNLVWDEILFANGNYYYAITAVNNAGEGFISNNIQVVINNIPVITVPAAPSMIVELGGEQGKTVTLYWDNVLGASYYKIYRETVSFESTSGLTPIATLEANSNQYTYSEDLVDPGKYYYRMVAGNTGGVSGLSIEHEVIISDIVGSANPNPPGAISPSNIIVRVDEWQADSYFPYTRIFLGFDFVKGGITGPYPVFPQGTSGPYALVYANQLLCWEAAVHTSGSNALRDYLLVPSVTMIIQGVPYPPAHVFYGLGVDGLYYVICKTFGGNDPWGISTSLANLECVKQYIANFQATLFLPNNWQAYVI